ncbi:MAG: polyribonucleotide nucleotidyltransferase [Caldilineaceae bacterium]|nr:polyribonucleotide nucleotidyltransferase [Caldilineaceae bacterium]
MQLFQGSKVFTAEVGGRPMSIEAGLLAPQANGAVTVRYGDTVLLATTVMSKDVRPGINFFPLTVDFEERLYAAGRIPGSFFRREGKPSEQAILLSRLVDRPLRPLFPKGMRNDVQVIITALSTDGENLMDPMAITAASAALAISDIPWGGPIAATTIGFVDGEFIANPTAAQLERSGLNLVAAGTADNILMVEAGARELPEDMILEALKLAHETNQAIIGVINQMRDQVGKPKVEVASFLPSPEVQQAVSDLATSKIAALLEQGLGKVELNSGLDAIKAEVNEAFAARLEAGEATQTGIDDAYEAVLKELTRKRILEQGLRPDGRDTTTIRPISVQVGCIPRVHGSGLFMRGETHVLTIATLGTPGDAQRLDTLLPGEEKRYMHHYNFPPFSTGEAIPVRGPKRREIGHGALAERALVPIIPEDFPYTLRLVSEVLSSNGSTSMGSVCGSTLALMDAGVPITAPVAGIAMGLIQDMESGDYQVLSDIQGMEDALGDMDFKVAGTEHGITALQMDLKIKGLDFEILRRALEQARAGRLFIMGKMLEVIPTSRPALSQYAPRILTHHIDPEKIGKLIGPGGKTVRGLQDQYSVKIDIEEDGTVYISGDGLNAEKALADVQRMTEDIEVGKIYTGVVVRVEPYGAFLNILPGVDGMVHISQLADYRVDKVEDIAKLGDELTAMVIDVDPSGKVRLSRQAVLEGWTVEEAQRRDRGSRSSSRPGDRGDRCDRNGRDRDRGPRGGRDSRRR